MVSDSEKARKYGPCEVIFTERFCSFDGLREFRDVPCTHYMNQISREQYKAFYCVIGSRWPNTIIFSEIWSAFVADIILSGNSIMLYNIKNAEDNEEKAYCLNYVPICHELEEVGKRIQETAMNNSAIIGRVKRQLIESIGGNTMNYSAIINERIKTTEEKREEKRKMVREYQERNLYFGIRDIIFNGPATIVIWQDGTKTVVKHQDGEVYDKEKAIAMAISKRALGNSFNDVFGISERFKKEKESLEKELNKAQEQWNQMSDKHKLGKHRPKSAVELEKKIVMLKEKIERCDTYIKKYS
jgi:hypothetical protein